MIIFVTIENKFTFVNIHVTQLIMHVKNDKRRLYFQSPQSAGKAWTTNLSKYIFFSFIFISWRLITLQYCSGFCHTLTWISHGFTCNPHPDPPSHLPLHPIPLNLPSVLGLSTCLMYPTWAGDLFHSRQSTCFNAVLSKHPTLAFSHTVQSLLCTSVSLFLFCI